ncbi:hypothetical protein KIW84_074452 [Lathyrus oleraceus]|uniref:Uncharacterized protein n=1 Tax=Pisum sativum TaxID=3888 RepID=A0A9D4ZYM0_PEA|nr:hypothetical protein KIW84_074452 [Pisum sativum]
MTYAELYPSLVLKNLLQPRNPPQIPEPIPWWYKPELCCVFHQGAPRHDIENCYPLKYEVQKLIKSGMVFFEDCAPNVKENPLPAHGNSFVNVVDDCPREFKVFDVRFIRRSLMMMHKDICLVSDYEHDYDSCAICSVNSRDDDVNVIVPVFKNPERVVILYNSSNSNNISNRSVLPLVIRGRVFGPVFPKDKEESAASKEVEVPVVDPVSASKYKSGESNNLKANDDDEVLRLIKKKAQREAWQKVLEKAFVEHDITVDQFDHIVANITSCNNLSFCDEELPEEGRNHNLALHISINCKDDALSNVLVDTGSLLNMLPKSTLSKLSYQGF